MFISLIFYRNSFADVSFGVLLRCVHTSVVGHRPTSADIVARVVEAMPTCIHRRRPMHTDASMNAPLEGEREREHEARVEWRSQS